MRGHASRQRVSRSSSPALKGARARPCERAAASDSDRGHWRPPIRDSASRRGRLLRRSVDPVQPAGHIHRGSMALAMVGSAFGPRLCRRSPLCGERQTQRNASKARTARTYEARLCVLGPRPGGIDLRFRRRRHAAGAGNPRSARWHRSIRLFGVVLHEIELQQADQVR